MSTCNVVFWRILYIGLGRKLNEITKATYAIQNDIDVAAGVNDGLFAAELDDFAQDADDAVLELG